MKGISEFTAELSCGVAPALLFAKQGDEDSRFVRVRFLYGGKEFPLNDVAHAEIRVKKPDGTLSVQSGVLEENNSILFPLSPQSLTVAGEGCADFILFDGGKQVISTVPARLIITPAPVGDTALDSISEYRAFVAQMARFAADIASLKNELANLKGSDIEALQEDIDALQKSIAAMQNRLTSMQSSIDSQQGDIKTLQSDTQSIQNDIASLHSKDSSLQNGLSSLQSSVSSMEQSLGSRITSLSDKLGGMSFRLLSQVQYDDLAVKSDTTLYTAVDADKKKVRQFLGDIELKGGGGTITYGEGVAAISGLNSSVIGVGRETTD